jgi:hypothetical protein
MEEADPGYTSVGELVLNKLKSKPNFIGQVTSHENLT